MIYYMIYDLIVRKLYNFRIINLYKRLKYSKIIKNKTIIKKFDNS